MNIKLGFSYQGLIVFLLTMLPNIVYAVRQSKLAPQSGVKPSALDVCENSFQAIFVAMLIFVVSLDAIDYLSPFMFVAIALLLAYFALWIPYFKGKHAL